jgi:hypothetical protein
MATMVGLISQSQEVTPEELADVAVALNSQASSDLPQLWPDCAGSVTAFPSVASALVNGHIPLVVVDDIHVSGAGVHYAEGVGTGQPFGLVLYSTQPRWSIDASHECLEIIVDPTLKRTVAAPSPDPSSSTNTVSVLVEVCDPCQAICYAASNGTLLSDFCSPAYYNDADPTPGTRYSFRGSVTEPRQVLEGGYISWFIEETGTWCRMDVSNGQALVDDTIYDPAGPPPSDVALRAWVDAMARKSRPNRVKRTIKLVPGVDIETLDKRRSSALELAGKRAEKIQTQIDKLRGVAAKPPRPRRKGARR